MRNLEELFKDAFTFAHFLDGNYYIIHNSNRVRCSFHFYHSIVLTDLQSGTTSGGETSGVTSLEEFCWLQVSHQIVDLGIKFLFFAVPSDGFKFITHPKSKPG